MNGVDRTHLGKRLPPPGLAVVSRGRMPRPLGLNNCRGPGGTRRRGGVTLYGGRERFRFRAADAAAERDGSSWLRPGDPVPEGVTLDTSVAHPARVYDYWLGGRFL